MAPKPCSRAAGKRVLVVVGSRCTAALQRVAAACSAIKRTGLFGPQFGKVCERLSCGLLARQIELYANSERLLEALLCLFEQSLFCKAAPPVMQNKVFQVLPTVSSRGFQRFSKERIGFLPPVQILSCGSECVQQPRGLFHLRM